jgi:hypothetical protein
MHLVLYQRDDTIFDLALDAAGACPRFHQRVHRRCRSEARHGVACRYCDGNRAELNWPFAQTVAGWLAA